MSSFHPVRPFASSAGPRQSSMATRHYAVAPRSPFFTRLWLHGTRMMMPDPSGAIQARGPVLYAVLKEPSPESSGLAQGLCRSGTSGQRRDRVGVQVIAISGTESGYYAGSSSRPYPGLP